MTARVRIVTDSNSDVPAEIVSRLGIVVVPAILHLEGRAYRDGVDISRAEFYRRLPNLRPLPTTAAPSAGDFETAYIACGQAEIVSIHLASKLSAIFNAARLGAEALADRVSVVDSGSMSMGQGWQVIAAAEAAAAGAGRGDVLHVVQSVQARVRLIAVLDTVEYLRRSGRAGNITAAIGELLQVKPLVEVADGQVIPVARLRTRQKARHGLVEKLDTFGPLERLAVLHTAAPADAHTLAAQLAPRVAEPPLVVEATAIIGTHVGPGALGLAAIKAG